MPRSGRVVLASVVAVTASACNPGPLEPTDAGSSATPGESTEAAWEPILARGIDITSIEANPGVGIAVADGGTWRSGSERNARMPRGRDTLVRVLVSPHEGWFEREIEARLILEHVDGEVETLSQTRVVGSTPSTLEDLDSAFVFTMSADDGQVSAGVRFQVELWEVAEGAEALDAGVAVSPTSGRELLGIEDHPMEMNIVFVPITYQGMTPLLDDADKERIVDDGIFQQNPLQRVNAQWHEPVEYEGSIENLGEVLPSLVELRNDEGKFGTNWFYAGLIASEQPQLGGAKGIAYRVGTEPEGDRVSVSVWNDPATSTDTIVHELGHNQSFRHVYCEGEEADDLDPNYKNETGVLDNWGYGIVDGQLRDPAGFEYMSYCEPSWVSDWTWNKAYYQIQILTGFDASNQFAEPPPTVLKAIVFPDGHGLWWVGLPGLAANTRSTSHRFEIGTPTQNRVLPARMQKLADSEAVAMEVRLGDIDVSDIVGVSARTPEHEAELRRAVVPRSRDR